MANNQLKFNGRTYKTDETLTNAKLKYFTAEIKSIQEDASKLQPKIAEVTSKLNKTLGNFKRVKSAFTKNKYNEEIAELQAIKNDRVNNLQELDRRLINTQTALATTTQHSQELKNANRLHKENILAIRQLEPEIGNVRNIHKKLKIKSVAQKIHDRTQNIFSDYTKALGGTFIDIRIDAIESNVTPDNLNKRLEEYFKYLLANKDDKDMYVYVILTFQYTVTETDDEGKIVTKTITSHWHSKTRKITSQNSCSEIATDIKHDFAEHIANQLQHSNGNDIKLIELVIKTRKAPKIVAGRKINLPAGISASRHGITNPDNLDDEKCFDWCLIIYLARKKYPEKAIKGEVRKLNPFTNLLKVPDGVTYPVDPELYASEYEKLNDIKINVWTYDLSTDELELLWDTSNTRNRNVVDLLYLQEGSNSHFALMSDIMKLRKNTNHTMFYCNQCHEKKWQSRKAYEEHLNLCLQGKDCQATMPTNKYFEFHNKQYEFKHPVNIIADFESTLQHCSEGKSIQKHIVNSFAIKYDSIHASECKKEFIYNNEDPENVIQKFIETLEDYAEEYFTSIRRNAKNIILTDAQKLAYSNCKCCSECDKEFTKENYKVRHHDHITGKFIAPLCNNCNLALKYKKFIPVYMHNLSGYDSHLFVKGLTKYGQQNCELKCVAQSGEKYLSFSKIIKVTLDSGNQANCEIRFVDSHSFIVCSLEEAIKNLTDKSTDCNELRKRFVSMSNAFSNDEEFMLMLRKGCYPYDWMDDYSKFNSKTLPSKEEFSSVLTAEDICEESYAHAMKVWDRFSCKTFVDYHNLYLKCDVLLLSDVWRNFKETDYANYHLDCSYYLTQPQFTLDCALRYIKHETPNYRIELLQDKDMHDMITNNNKGGICDVPFRYAKANNKYMNSYDSSQPESYILKLDANSLYAHCMTKYLPMSEFQWDDLNNWELSSSELKEKILSLKDDDDYGYVFEFNIDYNEELHDLHNNLPLFPEHIKTNKEELNTWQQKDYTENNSKKLCLTLYNKRNYVAHYRYLKLALQLGLDKNLEILKVIKFRQAPFFKGYIEKNAELRKHAKNKFEDKLYKDQSNCLYGKTIENMYNRVEFELATNVETVNRKRRSIREYTIFDENLVGLYLQKSNIVLSKPIMIGSCILDESKLHMYNFHYNVMLKAVNNTNNIKTMMFDTDSLDYYIKDENAFEIVKNNSQHFDLSNTKRVPELYEIFKANPTQAKKIGLFKFVEDDIIIEEVACKPKLYAYKKLGDVEKVTCKGIRNTIAARHVTVEALNAIRMNTITGNGSKTICVDQYHIRSKHHQIFTEKVPKVAASANNDKHFICDDNINTISFGHYKLRKNCNNNL